MGLGLGLGVGLSLGYGRSLAGLQGGVEHLVRVRVGAGLRLKLRVWLNAGLQGGGEHLAGGVAGGGMYLVDPQHGADARALRLLAVVQGDEGGGELRLLLVHG